MAYNTGSPMHGFNPWVVAVDSTASRGNTQRSYSRSSAGDAKHGRHAGPIGLLKRLRHLLRRD